MKLVELYPQIKKAIVAFIPNYSVLNKNHRPSVPPILGTGFFINNYGLIATNDHVVRSFSQIPRPKNMNEDNFGISAVLFYQKDDIIQDLVFEIKRIIRLSSNNSSGFKRPDLAFVEVNIRENPYIELEAKESILKEGYEVATSGFPTGRYALMGPDDFFQISPTLQRGIISAVLPYPQRRPNAFAINVMSHGGASGSPVFSTNTGKIWGILFSVLTDASYSDNNNNYIVPTNISYAIPVHHIHSVMESIDMDLIMDDKKEKFSDILKS